MTRVATHDKAASSAAITETERHVTRSYGRCADGLSTFALAVFGPRERSTRSVRIFNVSSRSGSMAGSLVSSPPIPATKSRSEEHTSELQSQSNLVCRLLLE